MMDHSAQQDLNRYSAAVLMSFDEVDGNNGTYLTEEELGLCTLSFLGEHDSSRTWPLASYFSSNKGAVVSSSTRLEKGDEEPQHFHVISTLDMNDVPSGVFLETQMPFPVSLVIKNMAMKVMSRLTPSVGDYVKASFWELGAKTMGYVSGISTVGAMDPMAPPATFFEMWQMVKNGTIKHGSHKGADLNMENSSAGEVDQTTSFVELQTTTFATNSPPTDVIDGHVTMNLIKTLTHELTIGLSVDLTESLTAKLHESLHSRITDLLKENLEYKVSSKCFLLLQRGGMKTVSSLKIFLSVLRFFFPARFPFLLVYVFDSHYSALIFTPPPSPQKLSEILCPTLSAKHFRKQFLSLSNVPCQS